MPNAVTSARLNQLKRRPLVDPVVLLWKVHRTKDRGARGAMDDDLRRVAGQNRREVGRGEVDLVDLGRGRNVAALAAAQIVEDDHAGAGSQQRLGEVRADKTGASGYRDAHRYSSRYS